LKRAKELIDTTFLSAKEVAFRVGIAGIGHVTREFNKPIEFPSVDTLQKSELSV
jgi:transcriptional regulator GlxA family with amidase domain